MEVEFKDLKKEMTYEIHVGAKHYYIATFKNYSGLHENKAFFDPFQVVFTEDLSWENKVKSLSITPKKILDRYQTDCAFFYVGACSFTYEGDADCTACNAERIFLQYTDENDIDTMHFLEDCWEHFEISHTYENAWHFLYEWWNGKIDPSTIVWNQDMDYYYYEGEELPVSYNRLLRCVKKYSNPHKMITPYEQGQYFHDNHIYKKIETPCSSKE
jgi:hypothetical protein